jgi:hypothetical protein
MARYYSRLKSGSRPPTEAAKKAQDRLMPRFFFHVTNGSTFKDEVGADYSSLESCEGSRR